MPPNKPTSPEAALAHVTTALAMLSRAQARLEPVLATMDERRPDYDDGREDLRSSIFDVRATRVHLSQASRMLDSRGLFTAQTLT